MMPISVYLAFIAYACATTFMPGPNNVLLLTISGQYGFKKCLPLLFGIWTGLVTVMLIAGGFCSALGTWIPQFAKVFKFVGAAYILYLAWKTATRKPVEERTGSDAKPLGYVNGFLLQFLNVKVIMLGLASFPGYFLPYGNSFPIVLLFAVTMTVCCGTGNLIWTTIGSFLCPIYNRYHKVVNLLMAALLVWCAWKIIK